MTGIASPRGTLSPEKQLMHMTDLPSPDRDTRGHNRLATELKTTWYHALRSTTATQAAVAQLLVPLLAAVGGVAFLGELFTIRLFVSGTIIAAGVALAVVQLRLFQQRDVSS